MCYLNRISFVTLSFIAFTSIPLSLSAQTVEDAQTQVKHAEAALKAAQAEAERVYRQVLVPKYMVISSPGVVNLNIGVVERLFADLKKSTSPDSYGQQRLDAWKVYNADNEQAILASVITSDTLPKVLQTLANIRSLNWIMMNSSFVENELEISNLICALEFYEKVELKSLVAVPSFGFYGSSEKNNHELALAIARALFKKMDWRGVNGFHNLQYVDVTRVARIESSEFPLLFAAKAFARGDELPIHLDMNLGREEGYLTFHTIALYSPRVRPSEFLKICGAASGSIQV